MPSPSELEVLVLLAPLHESHNIAAMRLMLEHAPDLPQVACCDTALHRTHRIDQVFALPYALFEGGIRRHGFHGLFCEYIASVLFELAPQIADGPVVVAHLGNGCSACAMRNRRPVATTMNFTALDGLPMGTRCAEIDAGALLYLMQERRMSAEDLVDLLYRRSGMLGLSGITSGFQELLASDTPRALFAVAFFCDRVARHIASLTTALDGLDGIVFTAGVSENTATIRSKICQARHWLGLDLNEAANRAQGLLRQHAPQPYCGLYYSDRRQPNDRPSHPCAARRKRWRRGWISGDARASVVRERRQVRWRSSQSAMGRQSGASAVSIQGRPTSL